MDAKALCEYEIAFPSEGYEQLCSFLGVINERKNKSIWERGMERRKEKGGNEKGRHPLYSQGPEVFTLLLLLLFINSKH